MAEKEDNRALRRVCRILRILQGHALDGMTLSDISRALNEKAPSTVLRTLEALAEESMVIKLDSGRWALSVLLMQIAASTDAEINRKTLRLNELRQRIAAY